MYDRHITIHDSAKHYAQMVLVAAVLLLLAGRQRLGLGDAFVLCPILTLGHAFIGSALASGH
ncbi:MAG: hypothetical protein RLZZ434_1255 [Pseudomonadota bacterium]